MTDAEIMRAALIEGAIGGAVVSVVAFVLSRFVSDLAGRTLVVTVLFAGAGAYFGFAFNDQTARVWVVIELLQVIAYGTLGLYGWRGSHSRGCCIRYGISVCTILDQATASLRSVTRSPASASTWSSPLTSSWRIAGFI